MKLISFLLRQSKGIVILSVIAGIVGGVSNTGLLAVINSALQALPAPGGSTLWAFIALCLLMVTSRLGSGTMLIRLSQKAIFDMRARFGRGILETSLRQLEIVGPHRLLAVLTEDIPSIAMALINIPTTLMQMVVVAACLVYLGRLSLPVLLGTLGFIAIAIASYRLLEISAMRYLRLSREEHDALINHFQALTQGTKELKLHRERRAAFLDGVLLRTAASLRRHNTVGMTIYNTANSWGQLVAFVLIGLLLFASPRLASVSAPTLTAYVIVILYMITPLEVILNALPILGRASIALRKVESLGLSLAASSNESGAAGRLNAGPHYETLQLVGVTHSYQNEYDNRGFTLGPVDITFRPAEIVFLAGGNGSGKTTLAKIITGLYKPEAGEIRLNGGSITDENRDAYRQYFSAVFSDYYLFNSLLGLDSPALDDKAHDYMARLQLDHKVKVEEGKFSTTDLSAGQRKRLALLTSFLEDRPFYVFDEWAADQDPTFRDVFYLQLLPELKARNKTVLVISHDDRYYYLADRLIKLDYGKVVYDSFAVQAQPMHS